MKLSLFLSSILRRPKDATVMTVTKLQRRLKPLLLPLSPIHHPSTKRSAKSILMNRPLTALKTSRRKKAALMETKLAPSKSRFPLSFQDAL